MHQNAMHISNVCMRIYKRPYNFAYSNFFSWIGICNVKKAVCDSKNDAYFECLHAYLQTPVYFCL